MTNKVIDNVTLDVSGNAGDTVEGTVDLGSSQDHGTFYLTGDADATDLTISFWYDPGIGQFFQDKSVEEKNINFVSGRVYHTDQHAADRIKIRIVNNKNAQTTINVWQRNHRPVN